MNKKKRGILLKGENNRRQLIMIDLAFTSFKMAGKHGAGTVRSARR